MEEIFGILFIDDALRRIRACLYPRRVDIGNMGKRE